MKSKIYLLFSLLSFVLFVQITSAQDTTGLAIQQNIFEKIMKKRNAVVVDVRTPEEYKSGYIGNAINYNVLDSITFVNKMSSLNKRKKYLLYCKSGRRSGKALVMMKQMGFTKVWHLSGGITDWKGKKETDQ